MDREALVREHKLRELIAELDQAADRLIRCAGTLEPAKVRDELGRVSVAIEPARTLLVGSQAFDLDELLGVEQWQYDEAAATYLTQVDARATANTIRKAAAYLHELLRTR
ncbi:MAG TPA: hypothetical protein VM910_21690 [Bradyrhizobium sp.]|jgi:hypothetical protein|nr:hypothetical protein [Bradyrhizobium sp.]